MPARDPPSGVLNRVAECAPLEADQSGFRLGRQDHEYELHRPDEKDRLYGKANRGDYICVAAPGVDIMTAVPPALPDPDKAQDGYTLQSGTSFSAPMVSAAIAWVRAARPELTPDRVVQAIRLGRVTSTSPAGTR